MSRKLALIVGNSQYEDAGLAGLRAADVDARELADVLRAPEIGQFDEVLELSDRGLAVIRRSIAQFFGQGKRDDLLVFYFSGHGVKDENGHLYLAVRDTELKLLAGTGIEAAFITAQMDRSYSKRQVLILDCCHSGAFAHGAKAGLTSSVGIGPAFEGTGYGHVVLTATDATQYAWEGDKVIGESDKSVFTHYIVQGLKTGHADRDGDGLITIDELYEYVFEHVVRETPKQTPGKWSYRQQGDIVLARNAIPRVRPAALPLEVQSLLESPIARLRAEAIPELADLLKSRHAGLELAARKALEELCGDDSRKVSSAAEEILAAHASQSSGARSIAAGTARTAIDAPAERVSELLLRARAATIEKRFDDAVVALTTARTLDPTHDEIGPLLMQAEAGKSAEAEAVRPRHETVAPLDRTQLDHAATQPADDGRADFSTERAGALGALPRQPVHPFVRSRPLHYGIAATSVAAVVLAAFVVFRGSAPSSVQETQDGKRTLPVEESPPIESSPFPKNAPLVLFPPASHNVLPSVTAEPEGSAAPPKTTDLRPPPGGQAAPAPVKPGVPDVDAEVQRLLGQGDRSMDSRSYDEAIAAYEEAARLGNPTGRERADRARQQKVTEVRQRLTRAGRLLDTGEYAEALRLIDEALTLEPKSAEGRSLRQKVTDAQRFEQGLRPGR